MWANFFGVEFWRTVSKFRNRKRKLLHCVPVLDKTWNWALSRFNCSRATTDKKCTKKRDAPTKLHAPTKESCYVVFPSSTKREIRHFHVLIVVVQRRIRNVQKSVMHLQSFCFADLTYCLFLPFSFPSPLLKLLTNNLRGHPVVRRGISANLGLNFNPGFVQKYSYIHIYIHKLVSTKRGLRTEYKTRTIMMTCFRPAP